MSAMPKTVARFETLMLAALGLGAIVAALEDWGPAFYAGLWFVLGVQAAMLAVALVLIWLAARRRQNWARFLLLGLFLLGLPAALLTLPTLFRWMPVGGALSVLQLLLEAAAFAHVFAPASGAWFRKEARRKPAG